MTCNIKYAPPSHKAPKKLSRGAEMSLYTLMQSSLGTTNCNGNSPSLSVEDERNTNNYCCDTHSSTGMLYKQFETETLCQPRRSPRKSRSVSLRNGDSDVFSAQSQTSSLYESFLATHPVDKKDTGDSSNLPSRLLACSRFYWLNVLMKR